MEDALRTLIDQNEIKALLTKYTQMVDKRDWGKMDEIFSSDGTGRLRSSGGQSGPYRDTLAWLARALEPWPLNLHFISNFDIRVEGDSARSSCYFLAPMGRVEEDGSQTMTTNAGYYHDELVRSPRRLANPSARLRADDPDGSTRRLHDSGLKHPSQARPDWRAWSAESARAAGGAARPLDPIRSQRAPSASSQ